MWENHEGSFSQAGNQLDTQFYVKPVSRSDLHFKRRKKKHILADTIWFKKPAALKMTVSQMVLQHHMSLTFGTENVINIRLFP